MNTNTGQLRRSKKESIVFNQNGSGSNVTVFSCSLKQTVPNQKWSSGYHRNKRFLSKQIIDYLLDNNYCDFDDLVLHVLNSKKTSDFHLFNLLLNWGKGK